MIARHSLKTITIALLGAIVAFSADLLTKTILFNSADAARGRTIIPNVLHLSQHKNFGLSFDIPIPLPILLLVSAAIFCFVLYGLWRSIQTNDVFVALALALVMGGALGNAYDRFTLGYVRDWILLFGRSVINIADLCILFGGLFYLFTHRRGELSTGQGS